MRFEDVLRTAGVPIAPEGHEHTRPGWLQFDCPFCSKGWHHYRMGYSLAGRYCNCWACGGHRMENVVMAWADVSYREAKSMLEGILQQTFEEVELRGTLALPAGIEPLAVAHRRYLRKRGFNSKHLESLWNLKGIGLSSRGMSWRLFVPITYHGKVVSWTTRSIKQDPKLRWRSAGASDEILNHKELLYGEDYCRHAVIVHEGPSDVWATGPGAVGTCGIGFSRAQVLRLSSYPIRAICFDGTDDAQERAAKLCDLLEPFSGETYNIQLETGDDPADVLLNGDPDELTELRQRILGHE